MQFKRILAVLLINLLPAACIDAWQMTQPAHSPQPLVVLTWVGYMPQTIRDAFEQEYGIPIRLLSYSDQDEAMDRLRSGEQLDVVVLGDTFIPTAMAEGLLAELDFQNIPNFRNLGLNFRDLAFDPENRHSIMLQWGTTGIIARTDRVTQPVTSWADLWNPAYEGKIGVWPLKNALIHITLKSLGYSLNSEDPQELKEAETKLLQLRKNVYMLDPNQPTGTSQLLDDQTVMIFGWSYDAVEARKLQPDIEYILPKEGAILWTDNVTIPANSRNKQAAELFINFLLRPEVSAELVNELLIPSPNEAARLEIKPDVLYNPVVYPPMTNLEHAEFRTTVSEETKKQYEQMWRRFLAAGDTIPRP